MIIACATNNGDDFVTCHFGDTEKFYLYELSGQGYNLLGIINNKTVVENPDIHADPQKAKGITTLLKEKGVEVVMSPVFGPNLKRIVKQFVPVISNSPDVNKNLAALLSVFREFEQIVNEHSECSFYDLRNNKEVKINETIEEEKVSII
jgi:predicted Fe-Mo cluster-binding NifX family protein